MHKASTYRSRIFTFAFLLGLILGNHPFLHARGSWIALAKPTLKNLYRLQFLDSLKGWVAGAQGAIFTTTNGGQSWIDRSVPVTSDMRDIFMLNDSLGWALTFTYMPIPQRYETTIFKTTNGGQNWSSQIYPEETFNTIWFLDSARGWMGGGRGKLMGTTDGGASWFDAVVDTLMLIRFDILNIEFFSPQYGFAAGGRYDLAGILWRTTNGGGLWTPMYMSDTCRPCPTCELDTCYFSLSPEPINDVALFDSLNIIGVGGDFEFGASVIRSSDGGGTWQYTWLGIFGEARSISFRTNAEGWVPLGFAQTFMYTLDSGQTWSSQDTPDRAPVYDVVFVDSVTGYMVGAEGTVLKYAGPPVGVGGGGTQRPVAHRLYQNYPNPFNPSTTIRYELAENARATLLIHDLMGREVAMLYDGLQSAGAHELPFVADHLAAGVYFCTLKVVSVSTGDGRFFLTRKLLLVK